MIHKTKGIVLRSVKYGESGLIVTVFTELFGVQSYLVHRVRNSKGITSAANYFQPVSMLELVAYHNETKQLQRLKEFKWAYLYSDVMRNVIKNSIALYMIELLQKCLKQPEKNSDLFLFCEDAFMQLDEADKTVTANFALFFSLHLAYFFGLKINDNFDEAHPYLDLQEGCFVSERPIHPHFLDEESAFITSQLLKTLQPEELHELKLNQATRRQLLFSYHDYYVLHIQDFGKMKTLDILHEVLSV